MTNNIEIKILHMVGILFLSGCSELKSDYTTKYANLNCNQLEKEYDAVLSRRERHFRERMELNTGIAVAGAVAGAFSGCGNAEFTNHNDGEEDCELRLSCLRKIMLKNECGAEHESCGKKRK